MEEYLENNNHRHLSHLYVAWPAYETQSNPSLANAANMALNNRNEALVYSNTGEIEILPALPSDWTTGRITGLMSRSEAEIAELLWDCDNHFARISITSNKDNNSITLSCGREWKEAIINNKDIISYSDSLNHNINFFKSEKVSIQFILK